MHDPLILLILFVIMTSTLFFSSTFQLPSSIMLSAMSQINVQYIRS